MILDVLPRPQVHRVWQWNETNTEQIRTHLVDLGQRHGYRTEFDDNGDGTATARSHTSMYGTYEFPVNANAWYSTVITYMGVVPELRTVEQINELFVPYPEYATVIEPPAVEPPNIGV